jgi:hypothetical protein
MKARDLAALAALGVAGYAAYNKFGKKDEPKSKGKKQAEQEAYNYDTQAQKAELGTKGAYLPETAELRTKGAYLDDTPEFRTKGAYLDDTPELRTKGAYLDERAEKASAEKPSAGSNAYKDVKDKSSGSLSSQGGPSRYRRDEDSEAAPAPAASRQFTPPGTQSAMGDFSRAILPEQRIAAMNEKSGASHSSTKKTEELAAYSRAEAAKELEKKKKNGTFVPIPQNVKPAVVKPTAVAPVPPVSAAAAAKQRAIDEKNFDSELMKGRRQAVIDTLQGIPSGIANIFKPREKEFQNKTYRDMSGNIVKYAKGGVVKKMASGSMASSKMSSKPSTASSRGDGIAQRGKTRGMIR